MKQTKKDPFLVGGIVFAVLINDPFDGLPTRYDAAEGLVYSVGEDIKASE